MDFKSLMSIQVHSKFHSGFVRFLLVEGGWGWNYLKPGSGRENRITGLQD